MMEGLTVEACPKTCEAERCAISGKGYCAHPRKGGLQQGEKLDLDAIARFEQAAAILGDQKLELKNV